MREAPARPQTPFYFRVVIYRVKTRGHTLLGDRDSFAMRHPPLGLQLGDLLVQLLENGRHPQMRAEELWVLQDDAPLGFEHQIGTSVERTKGRVQ